MIIRDREHLGKKDLIKGCIEEHQAGLQRMDMLYRAYKGEADILNRTMLDGLPNNKLVHSYPRYIVAIAAGYLVGTPVNYQAETKLDDLLDAYKAARVESIDSELAKDASLYGKAVELVYADEKSQVRTSALDPRSAFVVYDNTVENKAMLGVRYYQTYDVSGKLAGYDVIVYTDTDETTYHGPTLVEALDATLATETPHYFGRVPMVEYFNNDDESSDFEAVLPLINAYDKLQSDRLNDNEQLVQALLVITGARLEDEQNITDDNGNVIRRGRTAGQALRQDKMLMLPDQTAKAEYLAKPSDGSGADILRKNLKDDIHKFSMIPDLTDENFASNASGVAMKYKLFGLEQLVMVKERWFKEALYERLLIFTNFLSVKGRAKINPQDVEIVFKRSLPANVLEISQMVGNLESIVPKGLLLAQLPFVTDPDKALKDLDAERTEAMSRQAAAFGSMPIPQEEEDDEPE
jgi:SPP1 family phage portal protein